MPVRPCRTHRLGKTVLQFLISIDTLFEIFVFVQHFLEMQQKGESKASCALLLFYNVSVQ